MVSSTIETESRDDAVRCSGCQHSVDVRGSLEQIVCLAHLAVFDAAKVGDCGEFEPVRRKIGRF